MNALRSYPAHSCVPTSHILHTSSILLLLCSSNTPQDNQTWRRHCFSFDLTLSSSPLYISLGYNAILSCNHSVGARLFLPSFLATYNTALTHHYFFHSIHQTCCDGGGPLYPWGPLWPAFPYISPTFLHVPRMIIY